MNMTNPTYGRMADEFDDFDQTTLPAIPAGWTDASWHNDTCPKFECGDGDLVVFIDYADDEMREGPGEHRFSLQAWNEEGDCEELLDTDDWAEILQEAALHRLRTGNMTRADAEYLLAEELKAAKPSPDLVAHLEDYLAAKGAKA